MRTPIRLAMLALTGSLALVSTSPAQTPLAPFDAAVVVFDEYTAVRTMLDLNGDGLDDFVGFWDTRTAGFYLHGHVADGAGGFRTAFDMRYTHRSGSGIGDWEMVAGNFDGDGLDDFAMIVGSELSVWSSRGEAAPVRIHDELSIFGKGLVALDYDGDGLDDLVVGYPDRLEVLRSTGSGVTRVHTATGQATELHVFDHTGDGRLDIVSRIGSRLELWTIGTDGSLQLVQTLFGGLWRPDAKSFVVFGDIDGDGDGDIVSFGEWGTYRIFRRTGPATFVLEGLLTGGPATGLADLDGDGDLDGVCCGGGTSPSENIFPSIYHLSINDGHGNFTVAQEIAGVGSQRLAGVTDVDGNGLPDLVAGRTVLFNQHGFAREVQPALPDLNSSPWFQVHDPDGDGDDDLSVPVTGASNVLPLWRNQGDGAIDPVMESMPYTPGSLYITPGYPGDFDGDGDLDRIVARLDSTGFRSMQLLANLGGGHYVDAGPAAPEGDRFATRTPLYWIGPGAVTADFDGDGDLDLLPAETPSFVRLNDGTGFFSRGQAINLDAAFGHADLDGDGDVDLLLGRNGNLEIWLGRGNGTFRQHLVHPVPTQVPRDLLAIADADGDGDIDVLWADTTTVLGLWNDGAAGFTAGGLPVRAPVQANSSGRHVAVADVNADGHPDVLFHPVTDSAGGTGIAFGDGQGGFSTPVVQSFEMSRLADLDGDGDLDAVGEHLVSNVCYGTEAGIRRQYGSSGVGLGDCTPTLGTTGPVRTGRDVTTRITGLPGGTLLVYGFGTRAVDVADWPVAGTHQWAGDFVALETFVASGTLGEAGTGVFEFRYQLPPEAIGLHLFKQAFVLDTSLPGSINHTNGLEIRYGAALR